MADIAPLIEEREARLMTGWMNRDTAAIRQLVARDCMFIFATNPPELLDRPSFAEAAQRDLRCLGFRMGQTMVRRHGRLVWYTASAQLELKLGVREWQGPFLVTGLWRKFRLGGWKLAERSLAPLADDERLSDGVRRLQLWR